MRRMTPVIGAIGLAVSLALSGCGVNANYLTGVAGVQRILRVWGDCMTAAGVSTSSLLHNDTGKGNQNVIVFTFPSTGDQFLLTHPNTPQETAVPGNKVAKEHVARGETREPGCRH
jgi:hypothetical protein